jgi:hypothetical protein
MILKMAMKVRQILLARALQMTQTPLGKAEYYPDLIPAIKERYQFAIAPKNEDLVPSDPPKGAEFKIGKLKVRGHTIVINVLTVFSDGVVVDTTTSTDDADLFLSDLTHWAKEAIPNIIPKGPRYYVNQMEIQTVGSLENYLSPLKPVGERIAQLLGGYEIEVPSYQVSALALHFDQTGKMAPQPGAFSLERRVNVAYVENVWFTQAPLRTADHIALLKDIEK